MAQSLTPEEVKSVAESTDPAPPGIVEEYYDDPVCGPLLRVFLALEDRRIGQHLSELDRFYNRYYWNCRFTKAFEDQFGFDAGILDQNQKILETSLDDVDWELVEELQNRGSAGEDWFT